MRIRTMATPVDQNRRTLIQTAAAATALAVIGSEKAQAAQEKMLIAPIAAFESQDTLKPLPFAPAKLSGLSERLIRSHWENNYGGSVKALTVTKKRLAEALASKDIPPFIYNELKREHLLRTGSVVFHEY